MIVLACPACDRQYDVSRSRPGSRVRCGCDEVFLVRHPGPLEVRALTCGNCGAPVGAEHADCPYCGAGLSRWDRASTLCPKCLARMPADAKHCAACGVRIAPQALTPIPDGRRCPRCAAELQNRALGEADVIECTACAGTWLSPEVFRRVRSEAEAEARSPGFIAGADGAGESDVSDSAVRYIPCLVCGELMFRRQYRYARSPSRVVVDVCRDHGIWLDPGEMERITAFVRSQATASGAAVADPPELGPEARRAWAGVVLEHGRRSHHGRLTLGDVLSRLIDGLVG